MQRQRWIAMSHRDYFQRSIAPGRRDPPYQSASFIFPQGLPAILAVADSVGINSGARLRNLLRRASVHSSERRSLQRFGRVEAAGRRFYFKHPKASSLDPAPRDKVSSRILQDPEHVRRCDSPAGGATLEAGVSHAVAAAAWTDKDVIEIHCSGRVAVEVVE